MSIKLTSQKDFLNRISLTIKNIITDAKEVDKVTCTSEKQNGRIVTRIEKVSRHE